MLGNFISHVSNYVFQSINKVQKVICKKLKPQRDYINIINEIHNVYRKLHNLKMTPSQKYNLFT